MTAATPMRLLVSVRTVDEALLAAAGGADFIDLKEPRDGALGGLPLATVRAIVKALRAQGCSLPLSATIGDLPMHALSAILQRSHDLHACGVDYVKVGIEPGPAGATVLKALAATTLPVVPVFIADRGLDFTLIGIAQGFSALMLDTADKHSGSLFDVAALDDLQRFVAGARHSGAMAGLAGALRLQHLDGLSRLAPDFAGFRSALCMQGRASALDAGLLHDLARRVHGQAAPVGITSPA